MKEIPFVKRHVSDRLITLLADAAREEWLTAGGGYCSRCEQFLENRFGCRKAIITPNGFTALYLSMLMLGIERGDEVLLSAYSCPAAMNSVLLCGAAPVLCGIDDCGTVTADTLRKGLTEKTKAVVVNHYGGYACDMEPIVSFCRQNGLYLIEDCATAFGTVYRGQLVGTFGDLAAFSFNDKKDLCTGEGGALTVNDSGLWDRAAFRVSNGIMRTGSGSGKSRPVWIGAGFSSKVSELLCAALFAELLDSADISERKREICRLYRERLAPASREHGFRLPVTVDQIPNGNTFYLLFRDASIRNRLMDYLNRRGIESLPHYGTLAAASDYDPSITFIGDDDGSGFDSRMLRLPVYTSLSNEDVIIVCDAVRNFFDSEE